MSLNFDVNDEFRKAAEEITELHAQKNANYGDSFSQLFQEFGPVSGLRFLRIKMDRLTALVRGVHSHFESEEDTLKDLASYALMRLVELRRARGTSAAEIAKERTASAAIATGKNEAATADHNDSNDDDAAREAACSYAHDSL